MSAMRSAIDRLKLLAAAGEVKFCINGPRSSPRVDHSSGRVSFGPVICDGSEVPRYCQISVDGVAVPTTYFARAGDAAGGAGLEAGYEHFLALCASLKLLPGDAGDIAQEPNWHERAGVEVTWTAQELRDYAAGYRSDNDDGSRWYFDPSADECVYEERYPLERLLGTAVFESRAAAAEWLGQEIRDLYADGFDFRAQGYLALVREPIDEPIVLCDGEEARLWDGFHRVAASLCKGAREIRAIVVRPNASRGGQRARRRRLDVVSEKPKDARCNV